MSQQPPGDPAARRQPPRQGATGGGERSNRDPADPATRQRQPSREMPTGAPGSDPAARPPGRAVGPVYGAAQPRSGEPSGASARPPTQPRADRPVQRTEPASDPVASRDPFAGDPGARGRPRDPFAPDVGDARVTRRVAGQDPYADPYSSSDPFDDLDPGPDVESFDPPRRATRPSRQPRPAVAPDPDDPTDPSAWGDDLGDPYDDPDWDDLADEEAPVARRPRPARRPAGRRTPRPAVALPSFRMPAGLLSGDLVGDRIVFALFAASIASALLMAIVLLTQVGRLPEVLVVHLDAAGIPDRWGAPRVLWRLPLIAFGVTLMNAVVAWYVARLDRFAARFVLAAALVVQLIAWAALLSLL